MVARHYHIKVRKIVLYPIGGVSEIEEIPDNPRIEWRVAIAGPLASFVAGGLLLALGLAVSVGTPHAPTIVTTGNLMYDLGTLNVILGAFNLIPAFPMDGGRVFRALLAERMKFSDATKDAAFLGRLLGILMAVFGIFYNLWLTIIGLFIYVGASEETEQTIVSTTMARVRVKDVMSPETLAVEPEATVQEALEIMFKARYHDILVQKEGTYQGVVTWDEIKRVEPALRAQKRVGELPAKKILIFPDESILEAYKLMTREKVDLLPVVNREDPNKVIGVVTSEGVAQAHEKAKDLR
jgi:CBS domain-containing protein